VSFDVKLFVLLACVLVLAVSFLNAGLEARECPDWGFHLCYASSMNAEACSQGAYDDYAPFLAFSANSLLGLGVPACLSYSFFALVAVALVFLFLHELVGWKGVLSYFIIIPVALLLVGAPKQLWFNNLFCGVIPFYFAASLCLSFFLLLNKWIEEPSLPTDRFVQFVIGAGVGLLLVFTHNYGGLLFLWVLASALIGASVGVKAYFVGFVLVLLGIIGGLIGLLPAIVASRALVLFYPLFVVLVLRCFKAGGVD